MTPEQVGLIETALELQLPESYTSVVMNHPCVHSEDICEHGLFNDPDRVIEVNRKHRNDGWFDIDWPNHYFVIGDDGSGNTYFMAIGKDEHVYFADHDQLPDALANLKRCLSSKNVRSHAKRLMKMEQELDEEEAREGEELTPAEVDALRAAEIKAKLARDAETEASITKHRCASCGQPMPSYRKTCKYCGEPRVK